MEENKNLPGKVTFAEYGKFLPHAHLLRDLRAVNLVPLEANKVRSQMTGRLS